MISFSNGSLSGEVSNKRPLENGCMPKHKPRRVSAVRDFPPGCGPNAVPMNLKPREFCGSETGNTDALGVVNMELTNIVVGRQSNEEVSSSSSVSFKHWAGVNSSTDEPVADMLDILMERAKKSVTVSKKLVMGTGSGGTKMLDEAVSHRQEAINNPVEIERDEQLGAYVGNVDTTVINGLLDEVQEVILERDLAVVDSVNDMSCIDHSGGQIVLEELKEDNSLASFRNSDVEVAKSQSNGDASISNPRVLSVNCGNIHEATSIRSRDKYRPRRVSAVRDFPPNCGINVSSSIGVEKEMVTPANRSLNRTEGVELTPEPTMSRNASEKEMTGEMLRTSGEYLDGLHNVHVDIEKSETLNDGAGRGMLQEMIVATAEGGAMEFEECSGDLQHGITERADASNSNIEANSLGYPSPKNASPDSYDGDKTPGESTFVYEIDHVARSECISEVTPISMFRADIDNSGYDCVEPLGKEVAVYSPGDSDDVMNSHNDFASKDNDDREIVHGLMAVPHCPWRKVKRKEKIISNSNGGTSQGTKRKQNFSWRLKGKAVARKTKPEMQSSGQPSKKKNKVHMLNDGDEEPEALALGDDEDLVTNFPASHKRQELDIDLMPSFGPKSSGLGDPRSRVRETLRLFNAMCRKILQQEETEETKVKRIDLLAVQNLKDKKKLVNTTKRIGQVPGVEVGDEFQYRVELAVVGIHFPYQSGIDSVKVNDVPLATSIVTSGAYSDDVENADVLRYCGQGGNVVGKSKKPEDQKLERGNLALKNSIDAKTPVRVVRGWKEMRSVDLPDSKPKLITTYVYDGLYTVTKYGTEKGPHGKQVFMFELTRNPGQPDLAWKELKRSSKCKTRPGVCVTDITGGKEKIPIWAVNTIDDEKPPPFNYTPKMKCPDWYRPTPPVGCSCVGKCSIKKKCICAIRNDGSIPYNHNGALVETKTLVYECGPHCKCPPSCYNRSTQHGIKFQLEIFKTESRGWGVRALTSITSGSFICEYAGELLEEKEAEQRIGNDEYLFDIGKNLIDSSTNPEDQEAAAELIEGGGFTIDAKTFGNVGRFINHSCEPNLCAQNVIYDNDDKRMPHIMLFAMENIPPLQELTYCYNYIVGEISDSNGNIKTMECHCGAAGCRGRMY